MGVSCCVSKENYVSGELSIRLLPNTNYRFSGAYGVIIHRSIMQSMIYRSDDPNLYNKPFDIYTLGHFQTRHPLECYVCHPQIVVPDITISDIRNPRSQNDFWELCHVNKSDYLLHESLPLYILTDSNELKIRQFINILSMFIPYVKPIFVHSVLCEENTVVKLYGNSYEVLLVNDFSEQTIKKSIHHSCYALTSIYVNWTKNIPNIFDPENSHNIKYQIQLCPRCGNNPDDKKTNGCMDELLSVGLTITNNAYNPIKIMNNDELFFTSKCFTDANGKMHCI
jgi:hypothetical protein